MVKVLRVGKDSEPYEGYKFAYWVVRGLAVAEAVIALTANSATL